MIRNAIIVVLTVGTVGVAILGVATLVLPRPIIWGIGWEDKEFLSESRWAMTVHRGIFWAVHESKLDKKLNPYRFGTNRSFVERLGFTTMLKLPLWIPFVLFGTYPTIAFIRGPLRRHRRRRKGECIGCGYDLTGNESGVCPECGAKTLLDSLEEPPIERP